MSNALQLTTTALQSAPGIQGVFELEAFKYNFARNLEKTTGNKNGEMIFERERVLFMKALQENKAAFEKCDRFTIYAAFIELAVSGLTLNDGQTYIIPYGEKAQFQVGWKGRLEQVNTIPGVEYVAPPQIVLTNELDHFEYELGEHPRIIKHTPSKDRTPVPAWPLDAAEKGNKIEFVYWIVKRDGIITTHMMTRSEVIKIRDTYSTPFITYKRNGGKWQDGKPMKAPFWITSEEEAFKKTIIKRGWKYIPKTARMKALDEKIKANYDPETETTEETHEIDYGLAADQKALPGNSGAVQSSNGGNSAGTVSERMESQTQGAGATNNPLQGDNTESAAEIAKAKRSHKKKATEQTIATPAAQTENVITTASGTHVNTDTGEEVNPAASLLELNDLDSY